jgi:hypothetical protein
VGRYYGNRHAATDMQCEVVQEAIMPFPTVAESSIGHM